MKRKNIFSKYWSYTTNGFKVLAKAASGRYISPSEDINKMREEIFRERVKRKKK